MSRSKRRLAPKPATAWAIVDDQNKIYATMIFNKRDDAIACLCNEEDRVIRVRIEEVEKKQ